MKNITQNLKIQEINFCPHPPTVYSSAKFSSYFSILFFNLTCFPLLFPPSLLSGGLAIPLSSRNFHLLLSTFSPMIL